MYSILLGNAKAIVHSGHFDISMSTSKINK